MPKSFALVALLTLTACGSSDSGRDAGSDGALGDATTRRNVQDVEASSSATPIAPSSTCGAQTWEAPATSQAHVDVCSVLDYPDYPPASGTHYASWADFRTYDASVPWGFVVHALEHGAVALVYHCPSGCDDVLAAFASIIEDHGADPMCASHPSAPSRFIVMPSTDLPEGSIAAVAWEHVYMATCLDEASLQSFVDAHYAQAPEDLCVQGISAAGACG